MKRFVLPILAFTVAAAVILFLFWMGGVDIFERGVNTGLAWFLAVALGGAAGAGIAGAMADE